MKFTEMTAREIAAGVRGKKFSAAEVFKEFLSAAETDSALTTVTAEVGLEQARRVDEQVAKGESTGLLTGVPLVLSDNICVLGVRTSAGSRVLDGWVPPYDAEVWSLLAAEGAVLLGKAAVDEFGTGGLVYMPEPGLKTYGLRPTYGLVSRGGLIARGSSLEQIGARTGSMENMELVMQVLARQDPKDSTSVNKNINLSKRTNTLKGRRVATVKEFMAASESDAMKRTIRLFEEAGAEVVEISLPLAAEYSGPCYSVIMASEAFTNFAKYDGVRYGMTSEAAGTREMFEAVRSNLSEDARRLILAGTYLAQPEPYKEYYVRAVRTRTLIADELNRAFEAVKIDCILQPESEYASLAGLPMLTFGEGSLTLIGPRWGDGELLDIGVELEKAGR